MVDGISRFLYLVLAITFALNFLVDRRKIEAVRNQLINYWISVENLSTTAEISKVIKSVREVLIRRRLSFFVFYLAGCSVVLITTVYTLSNDSFTASKTRYDRLLTLLDVEFNFMLNHKLVEGKYWITDINSCRPVESDDRFSFRSIVSWKGKIDNFLEESNSIPVRNAVVLGAIISIVISTFLYSIPLIVSLNTTIYILSFATASRLRLVVVLITDIIVIIMMPILIISVFLISAVIVFPIRPIASLIVFNGEQLGTFDVALGLALADVNVEFLGWDGLGIWIRGAVLNAEPSIYVSFIFELARWNYENILYYLRMMRVVFSSRIFEIRAIPAVFNWAYSTDILFSSFFVLPSMFVLFIRRFSFAKELVLNFLQFVADHPKGPVAAFSVALGGAIYVLHNVFG